MTRFTMALSAITLWACAASSASAQYAAAVLADNPAGYWRFEEATGTQASDASGNLQHGTYAGGVTLGSGGAASIGGNSATFNGTSGYVSLPGSWGGTAATTIEAWVNVAALTGDFQAVVAGHDPNNFAHFQLHTIGGTGAYTNTGFVSLVPPSTNPTGQWRHLALVAESGNTRVYQNGGQLGGANAAAFASVLASSNVDIGRGHVGTRWFNGQIDEVAIYNTALTQGQLNSHFTAATGGLLGHYTFDVDGTDSSFQANHGTLGGGATITSDSKIGGGALDLRGTNGFVDIVNPVLNGHNQYTVSMWVNAETLSAACCDALLADDGFPAGALHLNLVNGKVENAVNGIFDGGPTYPQSDGAVGLDEWVHLAVTYDAATGESMFYLDGEFDSTVDRLDNVLAGVGGTTIGAWDTNGAGAYSRFFNGRIDDLRVYSRVLSADEIQALATVPEPASIALWTLLGLTTAGFGLWRRRKCKIARG